MSVRPPTVTAADVALARSEASLRLLVKKVPIALSHTATDFTVLETNDRFSELFGYTQDDIPTLDEWWPRAYPDPAYRQELKLAWDTAIAKAMREGGDLPPVEVRVTCKNGDVRIVEVSTVMLGDGAVTAFVDLTERKRAEEIQKQLNRELRAISNCNQALMRAEDEQALLDEVTRIIVEEAGYRVAFVAYAEHDAEQTVRPVAWAGMSEDYFAGAKLTWADRDLGRGPIGTAIRTGSIVEIPDIATDPRMLPWRERALARGYRSGVAFPLKDDRQNVLGGLLIYSGEANAITPEEIHLLDELACDLAFGITNLRARAAHQQAEVQLAASEQLFRAMVENSPEPIARYDRELRRIYVNQAIRKLFEAPVEQVLGVTPASGSPLVDPDSYMAAIRRVIETAAEQRLDGAYRTPDGRIGWASWRFTPELGPDGQVATVLVISHDITERRQAEEERQAHLHFLESLDRINRSIQGRTDIKQMTMDVLDEVLAIFDCDRAFLLHPCDPAGSHWTVPMERTRPEYPGVLALNQPIPMDKDVADTLQALLDHPGPLVFGPESDHPLPKSASERFGIKSIMSMALHPRTGQPWQFGIHQCSRERIWTNEEANLFEAIGHRVSDALNTLLITRSLRESEERFRLLFENSPLPIQEEDYSAVKRRLDALRETVGDDIDAHLAGHPELLAEYSSLVKIVDVNRAALQFHEAEDKETLRHDLSQSFLPETLPAFRNLLVALMRGTTELRLDTVLRTLTGRERQVTVYFSVCPGYESSFARIFVSIVDTTERKQFEENLAASEQLFRALVENSPDFIARYDRKLRRAYVNPALQRIFTTPPAETLGKPPTSKSPLVDPADYMLKLQRALDSGQECSGELAYRDLQGGLHWGTMRAVPEFDANGVATSVLAITRDITDRVRNEERLRLAASVFATSQEGILISDRENHIIDVNPAFTQLTGYTREEALGRDPGFLGDGRQGREFYAGMWQSINATGLWQGELWNRRKNGEAFAVLLSIIAVRDERGRLRHYVGAFSDISMIKAHEADLDRIAHYDVLTGVPNRRLLGDRLEQAIAHTRRHGKNLAVCYLDLDGFKPINDQFGHEGGDRLLVEIARRLQSMSRADDTVARLGGDEFVLLWNDVGAEAECYQALDRILEEVSAPMLLDGVPISVSASVGVTLYPDDNADADSLLRHADHAMYSAKQLGKNRYQLFDSRLERQITSRVEFLAKAERALDAGLFELHYQPKVDCVGGVVIGVEALVRWNDPVLGLLRPKEFLPLIEDDNLALRMGRWVMEQAVRQARLWNEMGIALPISINLFPRHLKYPTFIDDLRDAISLHWPDMPNHRLLMEIVETSALEELDPIESVIKECLEMGIGFSLDDFGTGYSSLIYLRRLSVEELKIDQSFVRDMLDDPEDEAIVVGVIGLGRAFGLRVVAEGVESDRHVRHLVDLGCNVVQGYGLGHPMPAATFQKWFADFKSRGAGICHR
ncbi:MAG: PAS domain S-box protein [Gammaproteobacteria bacterium]|nr:PAS domain S-box protein [Gammaproteobacteria bacterium]MBU1414057.1 PAS domain S-box protein [Gammaproteobacteria bacterium]